MKKLLSGKPSPKGVNDLNQCPPSFPVPPSPSPTKSLRKIETLGTSNLFDVFVCITAVYSLHNASIISHFTITFSFLHTVCM